MKLLKLALLFCVLAIASCQDEPETHATAEVISGDELFIAYMKGTTASIEKFNIKSGETLEEKKAHQELLKSAIENKADNKVIIELLGYSSEEEFNQAYEAQIKRLSELELKYFKRDDSGTLDNVINQSIQLYANQQLSIKRSSLESSFMNSKQSGCKGGLGCFRTATDCDHQAEVDLGVASAGCSSALKWFPPGWPICQGTALLVYSAEKLSCASALEDCCDLDRPKEAN